MKTGDLYEIDGWEIRVNFAFGGNVFEMTYTRGPAWNAQNRTVRIAIDGSWRDPLTYLPFPHPSLWWKDPVLL